MSPLLFVTIRYIFCIKLDLGCKIQGSAFKVLRSRFRVQSSGFKVQGSRFRVQSSGFKVQGSKFEAQGLEVLV
jgi:hypothetical protein